MYETDLRCLDRDLQRNGRRAYPPDDGMHRDLPAGRWRLSVFVGQQLHYPLDAYARGTHERAVVIEDGRTTEVKVEARPAGLVGFNLRSDNPPEGGKWQELKIQSEPGGADVAFHVYDRAQPGWGAMPPCYGMLFIGKPSFPPGRQTFLVTAKGYHAARCEVEVAVDRLVEIEVALFRQ